MLRRLQNAQLFLDGLFAYVHSMSQMILIDSTETIGIVSTCFAEEFRHHANSKYTV